MILSLAPQLLRYFRACFEVATSGSTPIRLNDSRPWRIEADFAGPVYWTVPAGTET